MEFQPSKYIYRAAPEKAEYTLLLLHGTGGDEQDLLPLADNFGKNLNVLSLRGNVTEQGMPRFFKRLGMGIFDEDDLRFRTEEMISFLNDLSKELNFDVNKIVALGYSNGANIIGSTLALHPGFFAGAILYRPMQPYKTMPDTKDSNNTPVFVSNGMQDPTINPPATVAYNNLLKTSGIILTEYMLPTGHNLSNQDLLLSVEWFQKNFR